MSPGPAPGRRRRDHNKFRTLTVYIYRAFARNQPQRRRPSRAAIYHWAVRCYLIIHTRQVAMTDVG